MSRANSEDSEIYEELDLKTNEAHIYQSDTNVCKNTNQDDEKFPKRMKQGYIVLIGAIAAAVIAVLYLSLLSSTIHEIKQVKLILNGPFSIMNSPDCSLQLTALRNDLHNYTNASLSNFTTQLSVLRSEVIKLVASQKLIGDIQQHFVLDSCSSLQSFSIHFPDGLYKIRSFDEDNSTTSTQVNCSYQTCSGSPEWWRRLAYLNSREQCPLGLLALTGPIRACIRPINRAGCSSVYFDPGSKPYSRVSGRVRARQSGQPDGFQDFNGPRFRGEVSLEDNYVDGISLTYGDGGSRKHIWTFAASVNAMGDGCNVCNKEKPDFIGDHFSCELVELCEQGMVCNSNLLWDGGQCVGGECFFRNLSEPTTEQIEMRVCREQDRSDEDILVTEIEIYVQ